jgi:hypothetical protein
LTVGAGTGGNITGSNVISANTGNFSANVTAAYFIGNGSQLTGVGNATAIVNGNSNVSIPSANGNITMSAVGNANILVVTGTGVVTSRLTVGAGTGGNVTGANVIGANTGNFSANVTASYFLGNGSQLTGIGITSGTVQNASGTSVTFTGIPSGVKRITVILQNISTNGSSIPIIRVGTSGGFVSTSYSGSASSYGGTLGGTATAFTTGFGTAGGVIASSVLSGIMTIVNISGTIWVYSFTGAFADATYTATGAGRVDAGGTANSISLTTVNGTDTFDAGSVNILYE